MHAPRPATSPPAALPDPPRPSLQVRFWGVRGSVPVSGAAYLRAGGDTSCVELTCGGERLVLDGGTGLRALGAHLGPGPQRLYLAFSHVHWDHIQGVPFFAPAFHPGSHLTLLGAERDGAGLRAALDLQMQPPQFPVGLDSFAAELGFRGVEPGRPLELGPFRLTPLDLNHPDGILAWRIEAGGRTVVYATDVEHDRASTGQLDPRLLRLAEGADLLVHDAQYSDAEYRGESGPCRRGWGHSTWTEAVDLARSAGVPRLALFHHDPQRMDVALEALEAAARARLPGAFAARAGESVLL